MSLLEIYALASVATGLWASLVLIPDMRKLLFEKNDLDNVLYRNPYITFVTITVLYTIAAPIALVCIFKESSRQVMLKTLVSKD